MHWFGQNEHLMLTDDMDMDLNLTFLLQGTSNIILKDKE